jgi:hypothetical protein
LPALDIDPVTGGTVSFTYIAWDNCTEDSCTSVFTVVPCPIDELCTYGQGLYGSQNGTACNLEYSVGGSELVASMLAEGPLVIGSGNNQIIFNEGDAGLIADILPGSNKNKNLVLSGVCIPSENISCLNSYLGKQGRITNKLLAQTLTLGLNLRVYGGLQFLPLEAGKKLTTQEKVSCEYGSGVVPISCEPEYDPYQYYELEEDVLCYMAENGYELTVSGLYKLANEVLGGTVDPATASTCAVDSEKIAETIATINGAFEGCRAFVGYVDDEFECDEPPGLKSVLVDESIQTEKRVELKAYPNPFGDHVRFEITSAEDGQGSLSLYNQQGRKVADILSRYLMQGKSYSIVFDGTSLVPGIYYYQFVTGDRVLTGKVVKH